MQNKIIATPLSSEADLSGHTCGNNSIDLLVKNSYLSHICDQQRTYKVTYNGFTIAFYSLHIAQIGLCNSDEEFAQYYKESPVFSAVYIDFIAVDTFVQNNGVGKTIIEKIIKDSVSLQKSWPVRLIIFDALKEKEAWYKNLGFRPLFKNVSENNVETVKMYMDLLPTSGHNIIKEYLDNTI